MEALAKKDGGVLMPARAFCLLNVAMDNAAKIAFGVVS